MERSVSGAVSRRTLLRSGLLGVGAMAAMPVLQACGGSDGSGSDSLSFWWPQGAEGSKAVLRKALSKYTAQSGTTVKLGVQSWSDYLSKVNQAIATRRGADVLDIGNAWSISLSAGGLVPFDKPRLSRIGGRARFLDAPFSVASLPGKTPTSVPWVSEVYVLYYNKRLLSEAGVKHLPETWEEFVSAGQKVHGKSADVWGMAVSGNAAGAQNSTFVWVLICQHGGNLVDSAGKPDFTRPGTVAAVRQWAGFIGSDKIVSPSDVQVTDTSQTAAKFTSGKAAFHIDQSNMFSTIKAAMKPEDLGVTYIPLPSSPPAGGKPIRSHVAGENLAVFEGGSNHDQALDFVEFLLSKQMQVNLCKSLSMLPVVKDAFDDHAFSTPEYKIAKKTLAEHAEAMPVVPEQANIQQALDEAVHNVLVGAATAGMPTDQQIADELGKAEQKVKSQTGG